MKKIILFVLIFTFSYSPILLSITNPIDKTIDFRKNKLCKTWYVSEAFKIREDRPRRDRTKQALGSTFTFNKDNTFILSDKSVGSRKPINGTWKETGDNSIMIIMDNFEQSFDIKKLTRDSLYLVGISKRSGINDMHIKFSSSLIAPAEDKNREYDEISLDDMEEPEIEEAVEEIVEAMEEPVEVTVEENIINYNKEKLTKTWILTSCYLNGRNVTEEKIGTSFIFDIDNTFNLVEFHKKNNTPEKGVWIFENNKLKITRNNITKEYTIVKVTDNYLKIREFNNSRYSYYTFKAIN